MSKKAWKKHKSNNIRSSFDEALILIKNRKYDQAMTLVEDNLEMDGSNPYFLSLKAKILIQRENFEEAENIYQYLITNNCANSNCSKFDLAILYRKQRRYDESLLLLNELLFTNFKNQNYVLMEIGNIYKCLEQYKNAEEVLEKVIKYYPNDSDEAVLNLIIIKLEQNFYKEACDLFDSFYIKSNALNIKVLYYYTSGLVKKARGELKEAKLFFSKGANSKTVYQKACYEELIRLEINDKNFNKAYELCNELINLGYKSSVHILIGDVQREFHNYNEALKEYKKVYDKFKSVGNTNGLLYKMAFCHEMLFEYDIATEEFKKICNDPKCNSCLPFLELIYIHIRQEKCDEALKIYYELINKDYATAMKDKLKVVKMFLDYKANNVVPGDLVYVPYSMNQVFTYSDESTLKHIDKHFRVNDEVTDYFVFNDDLIPEKLLEDVRSKISDKTFKKNELFDIHIINYPNCGYNNESVSNLIKVITIANTNKVITMYPVDDDYDLDTSENKKVLSSPEEEYHSSVKIKRLTQIEKFNMKYNK